MLYFTLKIAYALSIACRHGMRSGGGWRQESIVVVVGGAPRREPSLQDRKNPSTVAGAKDWSSFRWVVADSRRKTWKWAVSKTLKGARNRRIMQGVRAKPPRVRRLLVNLGFFFLFCWSNSHFTTKALIFKFRLFKSNFSGPFNFAYRSSKSLRKYPFRGKYSWSRRLYMANYHLPVFWVFLVSIFLLFTSDRISKRPFPYWFFPLTSIIVSGPDCLLMAPKCCSNTTIKRHWHPCELGSSSKCFKLFTNRCGRVLYWLSHTGS